MNGPGQTTESHMDPVLIKDVPWGTSVYSLCFLEKELLRTSTGSSQVVPRVQGRLHEMLCKETQALDKVLIPCAPRP